MNVHVTKIHLYISSEIISENYQSLRHGSVANRTFAVLTKSPCLTQVAAKNNLLLHFQEKQQQQQQTTNCPLLAFTKLHAHSAQTDM